MIDLLSALPEPQTAGVPLSWINRGCVLWGLVQPDMGGQGQIRTLIPPYPSGTVTNMAHSSAVSGWGLTRRRGGQGELRCDGIDDYVTFGASPAWEVTADFALMCWIRLTGLDDYAGLIAKVAPPAYDWEFYYMNTSSSVAPGTLGFYADSVVDMHSTATVPDTNWHHVAVSRVSSVITFYLDGLDAGNQGGLSTPLQTRGQPLYWGTELTDSSSYLNGAMDDLRLYTRGLTAAEMASVYWASALGYPEALPMPNGLSLCGAWSAPPRPQRRTFWRRTV